MTNESTDVIKYSEREIENGILFPDTVNDNEFRSFEMEIISTVQSHFKYGYGGYNGFYKDREELFERLRQIARNWGPF